MARFDDPRLLQLNSEAGLQDSGMRQALLAALEANETARAVYAVSGHIWMAAVLTDRALLLVKGAVRAKVIRMELPVEVLREPRASRKGARVQTPLGAKTLWGSKLDPDMSRLVERSQSWQSTSGARPSAEPGGGGPVSVVPHTKPAEPRPGAAGVAPGPREGLTRRERADARRRAGKKPRKPRRMKARRAWVGFPPSSTIWDISHHCVKCGRALTNPNSQRHRVGTDCIKRYGSQARKIANPAYTAWSARKVKADVDRIANQVALDAQYAHVKAAYDEALGAWHAVRAGRR